MPPELGRPARVNAVNLASVPPKEYNRAADSSDEDQTFEDRMVPQNQGTRLEREGRFRLPYQWGRFHEIDDPERD